jgi:cytochrome b
MDKVLVWDIPSRIVHWAFAGSLSASLAIAFFVDDDQPLFRWHMLFGIVAVFILLIRLFMGMFGARYAKFSSFPVRPGEIASYMISAVVSKTKRYAGNNPGSATAAILMFLIVPGLFVTGAFASETFEEFHEVLAWGLLLVVVSHLAGLAWHTIRHKENISMAMVSGRKSGEPAEAIPSSHSIWGVVILLAAGLWISLFFAGFKTSDRSVCLPGVGMTVQLGKRESHVGGDD